MEFAVDRNKAMMVRSWADFIYEVSTRLQFIEDLGFDFRFYSFLCDFLLRIFLGILSEFLLLIFLRLIC